jgi:hypothetical protein
MGRTLKSKQVSQHLVLLAIQVWWHYASIFMNSFTNKKLPFALLLTTTSFHYSQILLATACYVLVQTDMLGNS